MQNTVIRDWVIENMPTDTVIGNSEWWADRIAALASQAALHDVVKYTRLARGIQNPAGHYPNGPWEDFYACDDVVKAFSSQRPAAAPNVPWSVVAEGQTVTLNYSFASAVLGALFNGRTFNPLAFDGIKQAFAAIMRGEKPELPSAPIAAPAYSRANGDWGDANATERLRSIVAALGMESVVPDGDLAGYEFAVLGMIRLEIERLKEKASPAAVTDADSGKDGRAEFEALFGPNYLNRKNAPGDNLGEYQDPYINIAWKAWKAGRATITAQHGEKGGA